MRSLDDLVATVTTADHPLDFARLAELAAEHERRARMDAAVAELRANGLILPGGSASDG